MSSREGPIAIGPTRDLKRDSSTAVAVFGMTTTLFMKSKPKILILFILCIIIILGLWFYSLKLNLSKPSDDKGKFNLNINEIFSDIGDAFKNLPPAPNFSSQTPTTTATEKIIDTIAGKLNNLSTTTSEK
jgi:hypothetical protein